MNKKLLFVSLVVFALAGCRGGSSKPLPPMEEEKIEYHPLVTDSAVIDSIAYSGLNNPDAAMAVPDIPKDKSVNMNANDADVVKAMNGSSDDEIEREADPTRP